MWTVDLTSRFPLPTFPQDEYRGPGFSHTPAGLCFPGLAISWFSEISAG